MKLLRFASLGSLGIAISYPIIAAVAGFPGWEIAASSAVAAILVIRHQSNIRRVLKGAELSVSSTDDTAA